MIFDDAQTMVLLNEGIKYRDFLNIKILLEISLVAFSKTQN